MIDKMPSKQEASEILTEKCIDSYVRVSIENPEWTERQIKKEVAAELNLSLRSVGQRLSKSNITEKFVRAEPKDSVLERLATIGFTSETTPNLGKLTKRELDFIYEKFVN
jgi:hypothetical protein